MVMAVQQYERDLTPEEIGTLRNIELEVLGERIRRARLEKKISQRDLSAGLFTSAYLSSLELGKTRPTIETLLELTKRLEKTPEYFLRQTTGLVTELDEEQARILEIRLALLTAHTALERSADERAEHSLEQVALHLARLNNVERARYYYLLGRYHNLRGQPMVALDELDEARRHLQNGAYELELEVMIESEIGNAHYTQRRIMPALTHYMAGLEQINTATEVVVLLVGNLKWKLLMNVANCYLLLNDWEQAIGSFREALDHASNSTDLPAQANMYYGMAATYGEQGDFQRACLNLGRSLQIYEQVEDQQMLIRTRNALAQMYAQTDQFENAEVQVNEALKLSQIVMMNDGRCQEMNGLVTLALIRQKQNKSQEAEDFIAQALNLRGECDSLFHLGRLYRTAAEIQADMGNKQGAEDYYKQALDTLEPSGLANSLADIYHSYGQKLRVWGEVDRAFEYMEKAYRQRERGRADRELERKS